MICESAPRLSSFLSVRRVILKLPVNMPANCANRVYEEFTQVRESIDEAKHRNLVINTIGNVPG